ncbi:MAG: hypothetical protein ACTSRA_18135, partial [Promethearchaeota archaeon]
QSGLLDLVESLDQLLRYIPSFNRPKMKFLIFSFVFIPGQKYQAIKVKNTIFSCYFRFNKITFLIFSFKGGRNF